MKTQDWIFYVHVLNSGYFIFIAAASGLTDYERIFWVNIEQHRF